ncbi:MAG: two-component sensor histidine kinase [Proteobacteria bacterium]|nr:two-component sensor histidine kinase [Pseudomonadota bacterium]
MFKTRFFKQIIDKLFNTVITSPEHYSRLRRNIIITMLIITILPLTSMIIINHFQYRAHLRNEITNPLITLANKTRHSFELFLKERLSTVRFIAAAYTYDDLKDDQNISRILSFLKMELGGFVDLGVINYQGDLVSYAGPYSLLGKNYSDQSSFQETQLKGQFISNVFMGHRRYPHLIIAVQHLTDSGQSWILRATIDTDQFDGLIRSMGLDPLSDAFLVDSAGVLQTHSKYYGQVLETCPLKLPTGMYGSDIFETKDQLGRDILIAYTAFTSSNYVLVIVKPQSVVLKSWYALKTELLIVFAISVIIIVFAIIRITDTLIKRIRVSDEKRETALTELQHNQKLSSIGRLAAGVAHEINNPLAIINEKAGLMNDILEFSDDFKSKAKFLELTESVITSVDRCRKITHRLLGFAKRIDIQIEPININSVITEVMGFLEREAVYRKIDLRLRLGDNLHLISSDRGQLQQVCLNLLTNAFAAVQDGGIITVKTENRQNNGIQLTISDNGCGIPASIIKHIFDPFFSTKKEKGTGLGLSITYGIIKKLSGTITVQSKEGEGAVFTIVLPQEPQINKEEQNEL